LTSKSQKAFSGKSKTPFAESPSWLRQVSKSIDYRNLPLQRLLEESALRFGEKTVLAFDGKTVSYSELDSLSIRLANTLIQSGVEKGDRVALFLPNIPQFVIAFFGALKAGAVVTAINPLHREREVEFQLRDSGAQTIVALESLNLILGSVKAKTSLKKIITTKLPDIAFSELLKNASTENPKVKINPATDLAALQYTGGTTGTPKAAMLTHRNLLSNALQFAAAIHAAPQDVFLTALPLSHIYGLTTSMTTPLSVGAEMVLLSKFDATKACEAIQQHKVTVFCGVPTMYQLLLANPDLATYDLSSIRVCISGAAPLPPQVQKQFMQVTGGLLAEGYGLTEASPVTHCSPIDGRLQVGSIGLPLTDTEARIVDTETGQKTLGVGEVGELAVAGPQVMLGYWQNPKETAAVLRDGWLLTGDIARMDADGYCYIVDRNKDLIKHNGYSVYPRELEDALYGHPAVKLCAVVGRADATSGEVPVAFVVLKAGAAVSAEELRAFVNTKAAPYKAIRHVELLKDLPVSSAGKVLRRQLKI
jgi:long-chain acyl-CoA synthetase